MYTWVPLLFYAFYKIILTYKKFHTKINKKTKLYSTHFMKNMIYSARNKKTSIQDKKLL